MNSRVLVVDDSATVLKHTSEVLKEAGYEVETSESIWIISLVQKFKPDLILMDLNHGGLQGGNMAITSLKKVPQVSQTRMVLYSSSDPEELKKICEECGADGYIQKTSSANTLLKEVKKVIKN